MLTVEFKIKGRAPIAAAVWLASVSMFIAQPVFAQNKVIATFTFPDTPIKVFQNKSLPGSVTNDRKVLLGSVGSDLWHGPKDARDEFWMLTDRGPNGQIRVDGSNRRTFWVPEFNPSILRVKTEEKASRILETIPIVGQSGKPVTGLPNLKGIDETPTITRQRKFCLSIPMASTPRDLSVPALETSGSRRNTVRRWSI